MSEVQTVTLRLGDCVEVLGEYESGGLSWIICDPPYGLAFMGKSWDNLDNLGVSRSEANGFRRQDNPADVGRNNVFGRTSRTSPEYQAGHAQREWHRGWVEQSFRVLPPGGTLKAFSGTRTFHHLAAAMGDAGFSEIRLEAWLYGSGFPKSQNVSKKIDQMLGAKREPKRIPYSGNAVLRAGGQNTRPWMEDALKKGYHELPGDEPASDEAKAWNGYGTALKPSWEPVLVGVRP